MKTSISIHALLAESDMSGTDFYRSAIISIHALLAESDMGVFESEHDMCISIHALLAESDQTNGSTTIPNFNFYPRSPCGERLNEIPYQRQINQFLSTLSLRRATSRLHYFDLSRFRFLSTLSLRRATVQRHSHTGKAQISIHALLAESDPTRSMLLWCLCLFLSTLSLRRATVGANNHVWVRQNFYPRSPCGERRPLIFKHQPRKTISIHALLAESDSLWPPD